MPTPSGYPAPPIPPHVSPTGDMSCIMESVNGVGGLYIGNINAAKDTETLTSTYALTQSAVSARC